MTPRILPLSQKELASIATYATNGRKIYATYYASDKGPISFENLDKAFKAWAESKDSARTSNDDIANGFGSLFGELLKAEFGFSWQNIEDQYGTEKALVDEKTGSVIFPINAVWKRIEPKIDTTDFFKPMYEAIKKHIEEQKS